MSQTCRLNQELHSRLSRRVWARREGPDVNERAKPNDGSKPFEPQAAQRLRYLTHGSAARISVSF
jgi:hypothetical protein